MHSSHVVIYLGYLWDAFALVWLVSALSVKRTARAEPHWVALSRSIVLGGLLYWLFLVPPHVHWLHARVVPQTPFFAWMGFGIAIAAMLFAGWARIAIGRNWSSRATIKEGHELIVRGPYRMVRNPIYTGIFFALLGTAISLGQVRHFLVLPVVLLLFAWRINNEQRILREQFGEDYVRYCHEVKAFVPYLI